ncbi:iron-siderophore ABC transporter substrate-binding protein [Corynebacterium parakroppenstedtii]|uniref:iron-siderophore ABC transporter substrate-binding protein n=1 Tax=Corynebacterium parakroppenstedtii TaxID=2828363 RepID=UPI001C8DAB71|nr:ABC transporter substrate-binding protein [Corynebacterium parakroppenstedtii]MBY0796216.1 ABC transporter substrate-binding protein [Corynebacterium parakroppenstedtii]
MTGSSTNTTSNRRFLVLVFATLASISLLCIALSGCSSHSDNDASGSNGKVKVEHAYGSSDLPKDPKSVVSLAPGYTDALLALGHQPKAITAFAGFPSAVLPWEERKLKLKPEGETAEMKMMNPSDVPLEKIASNKPDAVFASSMATDQGIYDQLSEIAPTVAALNKPPKLDDWVEQTKLVGKIYGETDKAEQAINDVDKDLKAISDKYPKSKGATVAVALFGGPNNIQVVTDPNDVTMKALSHLGLEIPDQLKNLGGGEGGVQGRLSMENIDKLDADIIIVSSMGTTDSLENSPQWKNLKAVKAGRVIKPDVAGVTAFRVPTILSIPYAVNLIQPALEKL